MRLSRPYHFSGCLLNANRISKGSLKTSPPIRTNPHILFRLPHPPHFWQPPLFLI
nr:hypothetical protein [uncultured Kingella sp.]